MNLHTRKECRHTTSERFKRAGEALFKTIDALLTEDLARSFPAMLVSPSEARLQRVEAGFVPAPTAGQWLWTGVETTGMARPTSPNERRSQGPTYAELAGRVICLLVDTPGLLLAVDAPAGSVSDPAAVRILLMHPTGTRCVARGLMEPLAHAWWHGFWCIAVCSSCQCRAATSTTAAWSCIA